MKTLRVREAKVAIFNDVIEKMVGDYENKYEAFSKLTSTNEGVRGLVEEISVVAIRACSVMYEVVLDKIEVESVVIKAIFCAGSYLDVANEKVIEDTIVEEVKTEAVVKASARSFSIEESAKKVEAEIQANKIKMAGAKEERKALVEACKEVGAETIDTYELNIEAEKAERNEEALVVAIEEELNKYFGSLDNKFKVAGSGVVFKLFHNKLENGKCSCGNPCCGKVGAHVMKDWSDRKLEGCFQDNSFNKLARLIAFEGAEELRVYKVAGNVQSKPVKLVINSACREAREAVVLESTIETGLAIESMRSSMLSIARRELRVG